MTVATIPTHAPCRFYAQVQGISRFALPMVPSRDGVKARGGGRSAPATKPR
jgi:hypothetical protein